MITVSDIKAVVVAHFGLTPIEMTSDRQSRRYVRPRQIAMTLARDLTPYSFPRIAREFGKRDHTTAMHAVATVERLCEQDPEFRAVYERLRDEITQSVAA